MVAVRTFPRDSRSDRASAAPPVSKRARLQLKNSITTGKKTNVFELLYATVAILPYIGIIACIKVGAL